MSLINDDGLTLGQRILFPGSFEPNHGVVCHYDLRLRCLVASRDLEALGTERAFFPDAFQAGQGNLPPSPRADTARGFVPIPGRSFSSPLVEFLRFRSKSPHFPRGFYPLSRYGLATPVSCGTQGIFHSGEQIVLATFVTAVQFVQADIVLPAFENLHAQLGTGHVFHRFHRQGGILCDDLVLQSQSCG